MGDGTLNLNLNPHINKALRRKGTPGQVSGNMAPNDGYDTHALHAHLADKRVEDALPQGATLGPVDSSTFGT